jgi:D-serine deaminase-like pyridoxal phosphate-dependent protein
LNNQEEDNVMITRLQEEVRKAYISAIGRPRQEIVTPALVLDLDVARQNIHTMAKCLAGHKAKLRPHTKVQKSPELARLQVEAGAIGVCTATVWEAIVMSRSGIEDVLIANQIVGREKVNALAQASKSGRLTVAVDDVRNVEDLSDAVCAIGSQLEVLIEIDVGMGRGGVRSPQEAVKLAQRVDNLRGLRFRGVQGYEGHCMTESNHDVRIQKCHTALDYLGSVVERLDEAGFPSEVVSAGGTGTYDISGYDSRVTELQAGSYVFMDNFHGNLVKGFSNALTVLGTVIIQHGDTIVLDSGRKSVGIDLTMPTLKDYPFYQARYFAEEHALFDVDERCHLKLRDTAQVIPGYAPSTVNLYDVYHVVEDGKVTDIWPIIPRGPGHAGLLPR